MLDCGTLPYRVIQHMVRARRRGTSDIKLNATKAALCSWLRSRLDESPTVFGAFTDVRIPPHNSASQTIVLMANLNGEPVVIKAFFGVKGMVRGADNSLSVEQYIYGRVVPEMWKYTGNIVPCVRVDTHWNFQADRDLRTLEPEIQAKFRARVQEMSEESDEVFDFSKLHLVVTRRIRGYSLFRWLNVGVPLMDESEAHQFIKDVLLQVACTLYIFKEFRFMHNDLHPGNILVERLSETYTAKLQYASNQFVERKVRYWVRIFDFDHATVRSNTLGPAVDNMKLEPSGRDLCSKGGECNEFRPKLDWFKVLWSIYMYIPNLMDQIFVDPLLTDRIRKINKNADWTDGNRDAWYGAACLCKNAECYPCRKIDLEDEVISERTFVERYYQPFN